MRWVIRSKIHNATVTEANLAYVGSITIDAALIERVGLWPGERVLVVSNTSGARLETYVIEGERDSGAICVNGAAAHPDRRGRRHHRHRLRAHGGARSAEGRPGRPPEPVVRNLAERPSQYADAPG